MDRICNILFFFIKQKAAYEMRISDWSSDVCSSNLRQIGEGGRPDRQPFDPILRQAMARRFERGMAYAFAAKPRHVHQESRDVGRGEAGRNLIVGGRHAQRSEEHTSELQSLMRISYAVFCLKKKNKTLNNTLVSN